MISAEELSSSTPEDLKQTAQNLPPLQAGQLRVMFQAESMLATYLILGGLFSLGFPYWLFRLLTGPDERFKIDVYLLGITTLGLVCLTLGGTLAGLILSRSAQKKRIDSLIQTPKQIQAAQVVEERSQTGFVLSRKLVFKLADNTDFSLKLDQEELRMLCIWLYQQNPEFQLLETKII